MSDEADTSNRPRLVATKPLSFYSCGCARGNNVCDCGMYAGKVTEADLDAMARRHIPGLPGARREKHVEVSICLGRNSAWPIELTREELFAVGHSSWKAPNLTWMAEPPSPRSWFWNNFTLATVGVALIAWVVLEALP